jgi:integrase/recombinase XerD
LELQGLTGLGFPLTVEGNVTLTLRNTKGGKVRTITLRQQAIDILLNIRRSNRSPYIFWNKTEEGYYKSASNLFWEHGQETSKRRPRPSDFALVRWREGADRRGAVARQGLRDEVPMNS